LAIVEHDPGADFNVMFSPRVASLLFIQQEKKGATRRCAELVDFLHRLQELAFEDAGRIQGPGARGLVLPSIKNVTADFLYVVQQSEGRLAKSLVPLNIQDGIDGRPFLFPSVGGQESRSPGFLWTRSQASNWHFILKK
jgi:hypothetical protein